MIRINLLAGERDRTRRRTSLTGSLVSAAGGLQATQQKITLACSLILVVTGLGIGWWYWTLTKHAQRIEDEIVVAQKETSRLRTLIQQVQHFETRRVQLQQRVGLIEELRKGQAGPVHMLDEISRSLPDMLWLTEIKQVGNDVTINGRCTTQVALADFVDNLNLGGYFKPVDILDSQVDTAQRASGVELIRFSVKATFVLPGS